MDLHLSQGLLPTLFIVLTTGIVSGLSPCTLPTVVFVAAYVSGKQNYSKKNGFILSLAFVLGIALMLSILGLFAGAVSSVLRDIKIMDYIIAGIFLIMGLWLLKVFEFSGGNKSLGITPKKGSGILGAFLLGIPFGISASPCTLPITASVLAYSAIKGSMLYGALLMFTYAIGRSVPLVLVGTFTEILNKIEFLSKYQEKIEKISGFILILLACYFIWQA
jgi:cytochrome c-type biogenesis protein